MQAAQALRLRSQVEVSNLTKGFDDRTLIADPGFSLPHGGIGGGDPNGVGKVTLFKIDRRREQPDSGTITVGETVRISYVDRLRSGIDPDQNM